MSTLIAFLASGRRRRWFSIEEAWARLSHRPHQQSYLCDVMQSKWRTNPSFAVCIDSQSKITKDLNLNLSDMNSVICIELCDLFLKKCRFKWTFLWRLVLYLLFDCKYSIDSTCYLLQITSKQNKLFSQIFLVVVSSYLPRRIKTSSHCSRWILVPWGRVPFGQHQESRPLGRSNTRSPRFTDFPSLYACSESSDKSDWLRVRHEFLVHAKKIGPAQRSRFLVLTKTTAASGDENALRWRNF